MAESGDDDLDQLIRRVDPDRWLSSRCIVGKSARTDVLALYAFDHELARANQVASTPLLAEIRLTWWREVLDQIFGPWPVRRHPIAEALADVVRRHNLPRQPLETMIDGQIEALAEAPLDLAGAIAWADAVEGSVTNLAAVVLDPSTDAGGSSAAGRAWGLALLLRAGKVDLDMVRQPMTLALDEAARLARSLSPAALPAVLPARLARFDLLGRTPGPLLKRVTLVLSAATGRL